MMENSYVVEELLTGMVVCLGACLQEAESLFDGA